MSVTTSTFQNFVGGKWVDAAEGESAEIINPSTGDTNRPEYFRSLRISKTAASFLASAPMRASVSGGGST